MSVSYGARRSPSFPQPASKPPSRVSVRASGEQDFLPLRLVAQSPLEPRDTMAAARQASAEDDDEDGFLSHMGEQSHPAVIFCKGDQLFGEPLSLRQGKVGSRLFCNVERFAAGGCFA